MDSVGDKAIGILGAACAGETHIRREYGQLFEQSQTVDKDALIQRIIQSIKFRNDYLFIDQGKEPGENDSQIKQEGNSITICSRSKWGWQIDSVITFIEEFNSIAEEKNFPIRLSTDRSVDYSYHYPHERFLTIDLCDDSLHPLEGVVEHAPGFRELRLLEGEDKRQVGRELAVFDALGISEPRQITDRIFKDASITVEDAQNLASTYKGYDILALMQTIGMIIQGKDRQGTFYKISDPLAKVEADQP